MFENQRSLHLRGVQLIPDSFRSRIALLDSFASSLSNISIAPPWRRVRSFFEDNSVVEQSKESFAIRNNVVMPMPLLNEENEDAVSCRDPAESWLQREKNAGDVQGVPDERNLERDSLTTTTRKPENCNSVDAVMPDDGALRLKIGRAGSDH
ncbi:unnamed protein product [Vicia faba]|uniref:Uncharacterized protein n=1 Tax=Vicia faba TaxID=3906 RepID=A0AAV1AVP0_VICFA|nr:unnamed protein product [Vicia faba]